MTCVATHRKSGYPTREESQNGHNMRKRGKKRPSTEHGVEVIEGAEEEKSFSEAAKGAEHRSRACKRIK